MNYASIGSIIGHEITHGFDDQGRQYDLDGNLADWWEPQTQQQFLEKAQCIIDQYGNFSDARTNLNVTTNTTIFFLLFIGTNYNSITIFVPNLTIVEWNKHTRREYR